PLSLRDSRGFNKSLTSRGEDPQGAEPSRFRTDQRLPEPAGSRYDSREGLHESPMGPASGRSFGLLIRPCDIRTSKIYGWRCWTTGRPVGLVMRPCDDPVSGIDPARPWHFWALRSFCRPGSWSRLSSVCTGSSLVPACPIRDGCARFSPFFDRRSPS